MEDKLIERWLSGGEVEGKFREEKGAWLQWGIQINRKKNRWRLHNWHLNER